MGFLGFLLAVYGVVGDSTALVFFLLFAVPVLLTTAVGLLARRRPGEIFWFALISSVLTGLLLVLWFAVALSDFN